ncbi:SNF2 family N-terminal domain-containing protein [Lentinula edodes]|uniref:SNF2 family N-terminal domain-containing protein n=1 Tax=Lentinula edodes TaxID=5353 RepID=UPI001E8DDDE6|nr:SNF2 family N-terminal domain-containing protein [Lentinula edodes]KAH7874761.1 SNF2 family N-terminal domain-containing protein [Lentinula edodes]
MSTTDQAAKRADILDRIRLQRQQGKILGSPLTSLSSSSSYPAPPAQSRDATISSRYFPQTPGSPNDTVLVPSSSPLNSPVNRNPNQPYTQPRWPDVAFRNGAALAGSWNLSQLAPSYDPLSVSSGFTSQNNFQRGSNVRPFSPGESESGLPRKRPNLSDAPSNLAIARSPDSPGIQRPGQRRRTLLDAGSTSSEESTPESSSRTRLVRGRPADSAEPPLSSPPADIFLDPKFVRFNMTMPGVPSHRVRAAWLHAKQDVRLATQLASDDSWVPKPSTPLQSSPSHSLKASTGIHGKVDGLEEAHKAKLAAMKEKSKKSSIYANRPNASKVAPPATPSVKNPPIDLIAESPAMSQPVRRKRNKNMIVDSDSDVEMDDSEEERSHKRSRQESHHELRVLTFFNTQGAEALQELTGCTQVQAQAIIDLREFESVDDLNTKLGQGKKKAGPAGLSPRLIDEAVEIFKGYTAVDEILEGCEEIGAKLQSSIATWTTIPFKGKGKQVDTLPESVEDGALNLRTMPSFKEHRPKGYISEQPASLSDSVKLKDYQLLGLNWLHLLYRSNFSCILADEMGLGKTVQVISFLALLRERGNKGPHLIVVPSSTLENWCREFARFASSVSVQVYYGGKNERVELRQTLLDTRRSMTGSEDDGWDVLITTYNLAQGDSDRKFFRRIEWDCCVFDEGHVLKNFQSQRYSSLLRVQSRWRLLLTGTPLQNNLQELVSLMNFILPNQFGDALDDLRQIFKVKGDSKASLLARERVSRAKKMMTPFVLRRRKDQVLQDLPKKTERIEWCEITPLQKSIYHDTLQRSRKTVLESETPVDSATTSDTNGRGKAPKKTRPPAKAKEKQYLENSANVLMDLRKAALHPMLFRSRFTDDILSSITKQLLKEPDFKKRGALFDIVKEDMSVMTDAELQHFCGLYKSTRKFGQPSDCFLDSGKIQMLLSLLAEYQKEARKILIFSQFTQVLDILEVILKERDIRYLVLTGSTPVDVRQSLVDEFTEDESISIFLLSTKAGGMGINLTAASVVIMFDQDFNPHNDRQAQDRAYRIGQKRDVEVVKLISRGTIEEDMLKLSEMKLALDEAVAGDDEKGESAPEQEMKASLMSTLRRQFEKQEVSAVEP